MAQKKIVITGVNGLVGNCIYQHLSRKPEAYDLLGMDRSRQPSERLGKDEAVEVDESQFTQSDLSDVNTLTQTFEGMDTIVHMAADPDDQAPWENTLKNNIEATYHMFEAAKRANVRRVIYASSIQVSFGYFRQVEPYKRLYKEDYDHFPKSWELITIREPTCPVNFYGTSKVFGETLARMYSSTSELSCICIRMGGVHPHDKPPGQVLPNACTQNDMVRLVELCIEAPDTIKFETLYGLSNTDFRWVDLEHSKQAVGYIPEDSIRFEDHRVSDD